MTVSRIISAAHSVGSSRFALLLLATAALTAGPGTASAQRGGFGSSQRGSSQRGSSQRGSSQRGSSQRGGMGSMMQRGGGGGDRGEQMRSFFSQMRSGNGSSDDRRQQMQSFFSQMREQRGGGSRGAWGSAGGSRQGGDRGRGRGRSSGQPKKKPKVRVTVDLPEQYAAQDLDKDGQLGLYEWKLAAIAQFRTLDVNGDGFLTPRELLAGSGTETTTVADSSGDTATADSSSASAPASTTVSVSTTAAPSSSKKDAGLVRIAKYTFKALDKDKDGKLTAKEWNASKRTRDNFKKKKVALKLPIDEAGFVAAFPPRS